VSASPNAPSESSTTAMRAVREVRGECFRGELKIGVTPGAAAELTQPILRHLALAFPHVHVHRIDLPMLSWSEAPPPGMDLQLVRDPVRAEAARTTTLMDEPMMLATARDDGIPATSISLANAAELPMVRFSQASPRRFVEFWSLAAARSFAAGRFRGEEADRPWHMAEFVARGIGVAIGSPSLCRVFAAESVRSIPIHDGPRVRSLLSSRIEDRRPVVDAAHRQIADLVKRIGPLILPH